jgi:hypothetical protein
MVMDMEIERILRTYGKKLPGKREREELNDALQLSKRHSHACSEAVRIIPMHAILLAVVLEQEKMINQMDKDIASLSSKGAPRSHRAEDADGKIEAEDDASALE